MDSEVKHLIGNEFVSGVEHLQNHNPANGDSLGVIPVATWAEVEEAVQVAQRVFPSWSKLELEKKSALFAKLADLIDRDREFLARLESEDSGKPFKRSLEIEIPRAAENFRFFGHALWQIQGETFQGQNDFLHYTLKKPLGVVGIISPWNLPLILLTWKMAPALAAGNTVIAKPSELTPRSAYHLGKLILEAGFPPGVVNILHGPGSSGEAIVTHPKIRAISFTGGTKTGKAIAGLASPMLKKVSLELGGKNASILFESSDLKKAIPEIIRAGFSNSGQICLCGSRILIETTIYERAKQMILEEVQNLKVGDPFDDSTDLGPLISEPQLQKILINLSDVESEGGRFLHGGHRPKLPGKLAQGHFLTPTLIEGLGPQCFVNQEELFGPVVTLQKFRNEEHALELANDSKYGLSASIWSENHSQAHRVAQGLETGMVYVNCWMKRDLRTPFGGEKNSGLGREGGRYALDFFTSPQTITLGL